MPAANRVLIVGGGTAGAAAAIALARAGIDVELVEIADRPSAHGSGLTLQGNALRVAREIGVLDELLAAGYPFNTLGLRAPDPTGSLIAEIEDVRMGGPDLPASLGIERPVLARILLDRASRSGAEVRFGTTFASLQDRGDRVEVAFGDGRRGVYDLVIGADGIRSAVGRAIGAAVLPRPTGMGIWRIIGRRPAALVRTDLVYGGRCYIAGFCPTSESSFYAYLVEDGQDRTGLSPEQRLSLVRDLASSYHGPWDDIHATLDDAARINYTLFETHVLPPPWNVGRIVLIGDAAHSCPPTLAQGAAMALEDASVLAELVITAERLDESLFEAFVHRRFERAKAVVDASNQICQWLLDHERGDVPGLVAKMSELLSTPA